MLEEIGSLGTHRVPIYRGVVSHFVRDILRRALLENLLEVFFTWTGFKPGGQKRRAFREPLDDICLLKEFGMAGMYRICLRLIRSATNLPPKSLCSRDVRHLVAGHFASDLRYEIRNRIEATLEKSRRADAKPNDARFTKISDSIAHYHNRDDSEIFLRFLHSRVVSIFFTKSKHLKNIFMTES